MVNNFFHQTACLRAAPGSMPTKLRDKCVPGRWNNPCLDVAANRAAHSEANRSHIGIQHLVKLTYYEDTIVPVGVAQ